MRRRRRRAGGRLKSSGQRATRAGDEMRGRVIPFGACVRAVGERPYRQRPPERLVAWRSRRQDRERRRRGGGGSGGAWSVLGGADGAAGQAEARARAGARAEARRGAGAGVGEAGAKYRETAWRAPRGGGQRRSLSSQFRRARDGAARGSFLTATSSSDRVSTTRVRFFPRKEISPVRSGRRQGEAAKTRGKGKKRQRRIRVGRRSNHLARPPWGGGGVRLRPL